MDFTSIRTSEDTKEIYKAILKFQNRFVNAPRDKENEYTRKRYTTLESLNDYTRDHLQAAGLVIMQFPHTLPSCEKISMEWSRGKNKDGSEKMQTGAFMQQAVTTRIVHAESGQFVEATVLFIPEPGTGQTSYHATGAGLTYFKRQMFMSMLSIVGDEDLDGNAMQPPQERGRPSEQAPANTGKPSTPPADQGKPANQGKAQEQPPEQGNTGAAADPEIDQAKADFREALGCESWKKNGFAPKGLEPHVKRLYAAKAISADKPDKFTPGDFYTLMAAVDFEIAKKQYEAKGMSIEGVKACATVLKEDGVITTDNLDALKYDDYNALMDTIDSDLGLKGEADNG